MSDILIVAIVSITAVKFVRIGSGHPYFSDEIHMCFYNCNEFSTIAKSRYVVVNAEREELDYKIPPCRCACLRSEKTRSNGAMSAGTGKMEKHLVFALKVKDTVGAGDVFFVLANMVVTEESSIEVGTFKGNSARTFVLNIVGNKEAVEKVNV